MKDVFISWKLRVTISVEISNLLMGLAGEFRYMGGGSGGVSLMVAKLPEMREMIQN